MADGSGGFLFPLHDLKSRLRSDEIVVDLFAGWPTGQQQPRRRNGRQQREPAAAGRHLGRDRSPRRRTPRSISVLALFTIALTERLAQLIGGFHARRKSLREILLHDVSIARVHHDAQLFPSSRKKIPQQLSKNPHVVHCADAERLYFFKRPDFQCLLVIKGTVQLESKPFRFRLPLNKACPKTIKSKYEVKIVVAGWKLRNVGSWIRPGHQSDSLDHFVTLPFLVAPLRERHPKAVNGEISTQRRQLYDEAIQGSYRNSPCFLHPLLGRLINAPVCGPRSRAGADGANRCRHSTNSLKHSVDRYAVNPRHATPPTYAWSCIIAGEINRRVDSAAIPHLAGGNREQ